MEQRDVKHIRPGDKIILKHMLGEGIVREILWEPCTKKPSGRFPMIEYMTPGSRVEYCTYVVIAEVIARDQFAEKPSLRARDLEYFHPEQSADVMALLNSAVDRARNGELPIGVVDFIRSLGEGVLGRYRERQWGEPEGWLPPKNPGP